jgi:hypothetical protein
VAPARAARVGGPGAGSTTAVLLALTAASPALRLLVRADRPMWFD